MDYEAEDRAALRKALVALHICPNEKCMRRDLLPVALCKDVWGCSSCDETWYLPEPVDGPADPA